MFQTTATPVTVFKSTDEGAPQLASAAGSLKTLLKACLTTGYGSKQPLGWECHFETAESAAFRSADETSNRHYLQVKSPHARYAEVAGYLEMSALDKGAGRFAYTSHSSRFQYVYYDSRASRDWWLIGHGKAFVLLLGSPTDTRGNQSAVLYFGDTPSIVPQDTGNTVLITNTGSADYFQTVNLIWAGIGGAKAALYAKTWQQEARQVNAVLVSVAANSSSKAPYPDVISGGTMAAEVYLYEQTGDRASLRGLLPGIFKAQNDLSSFADGAPVQMDGIADTMLKFSTGSDGSYHLLINASHWEA